MIKRGERECSSETEPGAMSSLVLRDLPVTLSGRHGEERYKLNPHKPDFYQINNKLCILDKCGCAEKRQIRIVQFFCPR